MLRRTLPLLLALTTACVKYQPPAPALLRPDTRVSASFGRTWDALIDVFSSRNIPIKTMERASGFIGAEMARLTPRTGADAATTAALADCGHEQGRNGSSLPYLADAAIYNVVVRGDSSHSTVRLTVRYVNGGLIPNDKGNALRKVECESTGAFESDVEGEVKQRAETKR